MKATNPETPSALRRDAEESAATQPRIQIEEEAAMPHNSVDQSARDDVSGLKSDFIDFMMRIDKRLADGDLRMGGIEASVARVLRRKDLFNMGCQAISAFCLMLFLLFKVFGVPHALQRFSDDARDQRSAEAR